MSLVDSTYFVGELNIPNVHRDDVSERLQWFIDKYEPELLTNLFGVTLYDAYTTGIAVVPTPLTKWTELRDGKTFVDSTGVSRKYAGLKKMIACYVYYWFMRDQATQSAGVGEVATKTENADRVSPDAKMVRAWNELSEQVYRLINFLDTNSLVYTDWNYIYRYDRLKDFAPINTLGI